MRVAVGLRLGLDLCESHQCQCGSVVDARRLSFVCKRAPGRSARHDDLVARSFAAAGVQKTAGRVVEDGWEETRRRLYTRPTADREVVVLGRYSDLPSRRVILCLRGCS